MSDLTAINSKGTIPRIAIASVILAVILLGWFSVRWQIGNLIATLTPATDPNAEQIALAATGLAPGDPATARLAASANDDSTESIRLFEQVVRMAPNDFRSRVDLARTFEQDGQTERAEIEFRRAVDLAPEYAAPRWHLGNFFLRNERETEALAELKKAASHNQTYRDQVFSLMWDYFDKDARRIEEMVDNPAARAHLSFFLAARGVADASLRNWDQLSEADKARYAYRAISIADGLYDKRHFPEALSFAKQLGNATDSMPEAIANPSFESAIGEAERSRFGWQIFRTEPKVEITTDGKVQHSGSRSLRATFRAFSKPQLTNVYQTVVVDPGQRYSLSFWVRTDELKSLGPPMLEILNGVDDKTLVRSQPFAAGTSDWQQITLDFRAPENCKGIIIRTIRGYCGEECPITGSFWYDDFELKKL